MSVTAQGAHPLRDRVGDRGRGWLVRVVFVLGGLFLLCVLPTLWAAGGPGTAPQPPDPFVATGGAEQVSLEWSNPTTDFAAMRILLSEVGYASTPQTGTEQRLAYEGTGTSCVIGGLSSYTRYHLTAFAWDGGDGWSAPATAAAVTTRTRARMEPPRTRRWVVPGRDFTISGEIGPAHVATSSLTLLFYRLAEGRRLPGVGWVEKTRWIPSDTTVCVLPPGTTTYRARHVVSGTATWCVVAYHDDADHLRSWSQRRFFSSAPATQVTGRTLATDETWSGTVRITGRIVVPTGVTLTVSPGTIVSFRARASYKETSTAGLQVTGGTLKSVGTPADMVWFTSDATSPINGDWGAVMVDGSDDTVLDHAIIEYGTAGLELYDSDITLSNSIVRYCQAEGVFAGNSSPVFTGNRMYSNAYHEIAMEYGNTDATITGNHFGPGRVAINFMTSTSLLSDNWFHDYPTEAMTVFNNSVVTGTSNRFDRVATMAGHSAVETDSTGCAYLSGSDFGGDSVQPPELDFPDIRETELGYVPGDPEDRYQYVYAPEDETRRVVSRIGGPPSPGESGLGFGTKLTYAEGYLYNYGGSRIQRVDTSTGTWDVLTQETSDTVALSMGRIVWDGQSFWVSDADSLQIHRLQVSGDEYRVVQSFDIPEKAMGYRETLACDGPNLFITGGDPTQMLRLNKADGSVEETIVMSEGLPGPLCWADGYFWSAADPALKKFSASTGALVGQIYIPAERTQAVTWDGHYLWMGQTTCELWDDDKIFQVEVVSDALPSALVAARWRERHAPAAAPGSIAAAELSASPIRVRQAIASVSASDIPGDPLPGSPVEGAIAPGTDARVWSVYLRAGDGIDVALSVDSTPTQDYRVRVFAPGTSSLAGAVPLAEGDAGGWPRMVSFTATETGIHYLVASRNGDAAGGLTLSYEVVLAGTASADIPGAALPASPITTALPHGTADRVWSVSLDQGDRLDALLTVEAPTQDYVMLLCPPEARSVWDGGAVAMSGLAGPTRTVSFTATTTGIHYLDVYDLSGVAGGFSLAYTVSRPPPPPPPPPPVPTPVPVVTPTLPGHYLTTPYSPSTVYYGRYFTMYGFLKPRHAAGAYSVKIEGYRYERQSNGSYKWVRRATWYAKNYNYSTYTKYSKYAAIKLRGKWRIRAVHAHAGYLPKYSSYRYFTVR